MERLEFGISAPSQDKSSRNCRTKRKWREIESIKEKHRLKKELQELDFGIGHSANDLEF